MQRRAMQRRAGRKTRRVLGATVLTLLTAVLSLVGPHADTVPSWLLAANNVGEVCLAAALLGLSIGVGLLALRRWELLPSDPVMRLALSAAMGAGAVATLLLTLCALGGVTEGSLAAGLGVAALASRNTLPQVGRLVATATRRIVSRSTPAGAAAVGLLLIAAALFALAPTVDWDSLAYHLEVPKTWLEQGRIFLLPDNLHTAFVGLPHLLYLPMMAVGGEAAPALLNVGFAALLGAAVFGMARDSFGERTGVLALLILWGSPILLMVATTARVDTTLAFFLVVAHWVLLGVLEDRLPDRYLYLTAALLGLAVGIKYTALLYAAALAPVATIAWLWPAKAGRGSPRTATLGGATAVFLLAMAPWLVKNWALLGAPFAPYLGGPNVPPWIAALIGADQVGPEMRGILSAFPKSFRVPFNLGDFFLHPERLSPEADATLYGGNPVLLLLPLWVVHWKDRRLFQVGVPGLLFAAGILVYSQTTNLRYLMPALPPLTVVAAALVGRAASLLPAGRWVRGSAGAVGVAVSLLAMVAQFAWAPVTGAAAGVLSPAEFFQQHEREEEVGDYAATARFASRTLDQDARVLLLFEPREYLFEVDALQDTNSFYTWPLLAHLGTSGERCFPELPATHILIRHEAPRFFRNRGVSGEDLRLDQLRTFTARCLEPRHAIGGYTLYDLRRPSGEELTTGSGPRTDE